MEKFIELAATTDLQEAQAQSNDLLVSDIWEGKSPAMDNLMSKLSTQSVASDASSSEAQVNTAELKGSAHVDGVAKKATAAKCGSKKRKTAAAKAEPSIVDPTTTVAASASAEAVKLESQSEQPKELTPIDMSALGIEAAAASKPQVKRSRAQRKSKVATAGSEDATLDLQKPSVGQSKVEQMDKNAEQSQTTEPMEQRTSSALIRQSGQAGQGQIGQRQTMQTERTMQTGQENLPNAHWVEKILKTVVQQQAQQAQARSSQNPTFEHKIQRCGPNTDSLNESEPEKPTKSKRSKYNAADIFDIRKLRIIGLTTGQLNQLISNLDKNGMPRQLPQRIIIHHGASMDDLSSFKNYEIDFCFSPELHWYQQELISRGNLREKLDVSQKKASNTVRRYSENLEYSEKGSDESADLITDIDDY